MKWPGRAAVTISVVHVVKGAWTGERLLDERPVDVITAYLFHLGSNEDPAQLAANADKGFIGSYVLGMGFTFDDTDTKGVASPLAERTRLIEADPRNGEVILPYIGGDEVLNTPTHDFHRYVINFGERSEAECRAQWPQLMALVEEKVKPERMKLADNPDGRRRKNHWWQFGRYTPALFAAIVDFERVLVVPRTSTHVTFVFLPTGMVFSENTVVFAFDDFIKFGLLQSRVHDIWVRFTSSTFEDRIGYRPSDCFETFPFPDRWDSDYKHTGVSEAYYKHRAALMVANREGPTETYNRFHDPYEHDPRIERLRELHTEMDRTVLRAYGWDDIPTECEFLLDYEIDEEEWGNKRKPYRYRWPDEVRDQVLARLVALNGERAAAERRSGAAAEKRTRGRRPPEAGSGQMEVLF
jgi:hypothetical protein